MMVELLNQPEGKTLEFKQDLSSPKPILKSLVAFVGKKVRSEQWLVGSSDVSRRQLPTIHSPLSTPHYPLPTENTRVFRELNLIEQWGTDVRRIFEEAKALGLSEPKIEEVGMRLRFTIYLEKPHKIDSTAKVEKESTQSDDKVMQLLHCLQDGEKSAGELREMLGLKHRQTFRENYLHPALQQGLIERTLPDKPNSRLQKYRLVEAKL